MKMIKLFVSIFILFALAGFGQDPAPGDGVLGKDNSFASKDGRFTVTLPVGFSSPAFATRSNVTDAGNVLINQYSANAARGTWMFVYYDFPEDLFQRKTIQQMLIDGRDRALQNMSATLQREADVVVDGFPGKSFFLQVPSEGKVIFARTDFIIARPRAYNVLYLSFDEAELTKPDIKSFFNSIHIQK